MQVSEGDRQLGGRSAAGRVVAYVLVCCLITSCATGDRQPQRRIDQDHDPMPTRSAPSTGSTPSPVPRPSRSPDGERSPERRDPHPKDPATLAAQLNDAVATIADHRASAAERRRAGEFQQLAIRSLANAPEGFRRDVTERLDADAAELSTRQLKAAAALATISGPAEEMPEWRVVAPDPPAELRRHYRAAQRRTGVHWSYLAAIHLVETRMGRIRGTSTAGAQGPMQFVPETWETYGEGGDINDNRDAIMAAGRLLAANGAPDDMSEALYHYNPADGYVRAVQQYARTMRSSKSAYHGYWQWRVIYGHEKGTFLLPVGYPKKPAVRLPAVG